MANNLVDEMRPNKNDNTVKIPITFSKRSEGSMETKTLVLVILAATFVFIMSLIGLITGNLAWYFSYPLAIVSIYLYAFFLRFFIFKEGRVSDAYESMKSRDLRASTNAIWNIYHVSKKEPYVVYYANGLKGIFIRLNKDVIVGKEDNLSFRHFEGVSAMYNTAHTLNLDIVMIDYMDSIGNDSRMASVHRVASNASNPELKAVLTSIYSNLENEMSKDYTSYDVYLFTTRGREEDLWYKVKQVIEIGLNANYKSYSLMPAREIRLATEALFNLEEFSINEAQDEVVNATLTSLVKPIKLIRSDGTVEVYNKTRKEMEDDIKFKKEQIKSNRKSMKNTDVLLNDISKDSELVDLIEDENELDSFWTNNSKSKKKKSKGKLKDKTKESNNDDMEDIF